MQKSNASLTERTFSVLLFDGFSNLCLANAVEPLRAANSLSRKPLYRWQFLSLTGEAVLSSSGLPVQPEAFTRQSRGNYLFVMPGYGHLDFSKAEVHRRLRAAASRFSTIVGLDTGSWLLGAAGLLDGYRATSHWDILLSLSENFTDIEVVEDRFVIDRDRITCGGATTTLDLLFALIERHHGATLALEVAALFMHGERDPSTDPVRFVSSDETVKAAAAVMRRNVEAPQTIGEIARSLGFGQRALELAFRTHAGRTPVRIYRSIRLAEARRRLEQTRESVAEIAGRCGYRDATAMTRAFKSEFGSTPSAVRQLARVENRGPTRR